MIYLDLDALLRVADRVLPAVRITDMGVLESVLARPRARTFGADAYPDLHTKAAALVHSLAIGDVEDVTDIAAIFASATQPRP